MAEEFDMKPHQSTYGRVMGMMKWGTIACALVAAIVVLLIA